jgi:glycosyltransferase involved in cell wall biosynthesis
VLKILHIAVENFAGVPYSFVQMHRACGDESKLVSFYRTPYKFPEEACLNYFVPRNIISRTWRRTKITSLHRSIARKEKTYPVYFEPKNFFESLYFDLVESNRTKKVMSFIEEHELNKFDIIHYDGGMDFFRDSRIAKNWKIDGKKIVCCYFGSDLRSRGLMRELDRISDLNITSEFDHLKMHPNIHYLFYPFNIDELPKKIKNESGRVRIIHTPTNRKFKGTKLILNVINKIKKERRIEFVLLEKQTRPKVLDVKASCDICIDQVGGSMGGTGYGKSGLESLGMGIPTITNMTKEYDNFLHQNPFIIANDANELYTRLIDLIDSEKLREEIAIKSQKWVREYHSFENVNNVLKQHYREHGIL